MGTSTSYSAPPSWGDLKSAVTRHAKEGHASPQRIGEIVRSFVSHNGGASAIARGGGGGSGIARGSNARAAAVGLGGFIADVGRLGLEGALRAAGWDDLVGKPVREVLRALLDRLGGESSTIDDVDARMALAALEKEYFDRAQSPEELEQLMKAQVSNIEGLLQDYFGFYLYEVFCRVFFERLVQKVGETRALSLLDQIKGFIREKLRNIAVTRDLSNVDWNSADGLAISAEVMESTLRVFE